MTHVRLVALLLLALPGLAACDQIRTPGDNRPVAPDETPPPAPAPDPVEQPATPDPAGPAEPGDPAEGPSPLAATSLEEINAVRCGLLDPGLATPTAAQLAGKTTVKPAAERLLTTEAVNATVARRADYPGIVKMEPREIMANSVASGHCGATRIAEHWFVTAAHCVDDDYDEIRFIAGVEALDSPLAQIVNASASVCHAAYTGSSTSYSNDIALIRVGDDSLDSLAGVPLARFGATAKPLSQVNYPTVDMAGWGLTGFSEGLSNELLAATLSVDAVGPANIRVASLRGSGPCIGDSGGPLYVTEANGERVVVGVLSVVEQNRETGEFCAGDYKGRYTNLQGYTDWIDRVIATCDTDPAACR